MKKVLLMGAAIALVPGMALANDYHRDHMRSDRSHENMIESMFDFGSGRDNLNVGTSLSANSVAKVQKILQNEGFYRLPVDGNWGPDTVSALLQFQRQNDLKATGRVDAKTAEALNKFGTQYEIYIEDHGDNSEVAVKNVTPEIKK